MRRAERVVGAGAPRRRRPVVAARPELSQLRRVLPPRLGAGAPRRAQAVLRGLRRADAASALRRARRARSGSPGEDADRLLVLTTLLSPRRARLGDVAARPRALRRLARAAGDAVRRLELRVPALRGARVRRRAVPRARRLGRRPRGRAGPGAAPRRCSCSPGCCGPRRWILAGLLWLWRWPAADTGRRVRGALVVLVAPVLWCLVDLVGDRRPAALGHRDERARRGPRPRSRDRQGAAALRHAARGRRAAAGRARRACSARCSPCARSACGAMAIPLGAARRRGRSRSSAPASLGLSILPALPHGPRGRALRLRRLRGRGLHARCPPGTAGAGRGARPPSRAAGGRRRRSSW